MKNYLDCKYSILIYLKWAHHKKIATTQKKNHHMYL